MEPRVRITEELSIGSSPLWMMEGESILLGLHLGLQHLTVVLHILLVHILLDLDAVVVVVAGCHGHVGVLGGQSACCGV